MRYFLTLAYRGARYAGWQRQPNAPSVQETLETALSTILQQPAALTGCGRTDTGVHARQYVAHLDITRELPAAFLQGLNSILPDDIAVFSAVPMPATAHARFDALERSYEYRITLIKDPFEAETAWFYPQGRLLDTGRMAEVAAILLQYQAFLPFCKTGSDVGNYHCTLKQAQWLTDAAGRLLTFQITANRFLRGMVRLIVGASVLAGRGQLDPGEVEAALKAQVPLKKNLSVPPQGLALTAVIYPYAIVS